MRQHSRISFRPDSRIKVTERLQGTPLGDTGDISLGGLRLIAGAALEVGRRYEMVLHVPQHNGRVREIEVTMVWRGHVLHAGPQGDVRVARGRQPGKHHQHHQQPRRDAR
ncbi:hypothetical protein GII23_02220 [Stutzerimonas balearica]|nr:hypothetical protein GII23_02220 [Stutzerimonas balearica]